MTELDLLILGSGVAGLSAAVGASAEHGLSVGVLSKAELELATTRWAQGGVAAALSGDPAELDLHFTDTLAAGAGLCDADAVRVLVDEGPRRVLDLISRGARFDQNEAGELELAREGGHSVARVVHAGGAATGAEIERALVAAVRGTASEIHERTFALELIVEDGRCAGVSATTDGVTTFEVRARHTLLATGGAGQLFAVTTNPPVATGDGVAMALRVGAAVADLEFFQFHPTALDHPAMPRALLSEALRGHGALLRDGTGQRFVDEMLPRDVVSRAMTKVMADQHIDHVWLDATGLDQFDQRFPTIAAELAMAGLDASDDWLPVAPAAHHQCGGIVTDLFGATTVAGLWGAGEVTCSGVHGANRLASNSLLEGMVFGGRVVDAIANGVDGPSVTGAMRSVLGDGSVGMSIGGRRLGRPPELFDGPSEGCGEPHRVASLRHELQRSMTVFAGVLRSAESLAQARARVAEALAEVPRDSTDPATRELRNLAEVGSVLLWSAEHRIESRGAHTRTDHPEADESMRLRLVV